MIDELLLSHQECEMPYTQEISRENPTLFVFLLDQSYSMEEPIGGNNPEGRRKMDELAAAINSWLQNMAIRATGSEGVKHWMDVALIGYRTDQQANPVIESPLAGALAGKVLCSVVEIAENPARTDQRTRSFFDEETGEVMETPEEALIWVEAKAEGGTPMCSALRMAYDLTDEWIQRHPQSFPPIVIHITDGESQEGDPLPYAEPIMDLATSDGNVLLLNCHLSMSAEDPFLFPHSGEILPDREARVLFQMSSPLPDSMYQRAVAEGFELQPGARGMAFNADMVTLIKFLDMGTRIAKLR
jgi:hypothetical protein